MAYRDPYTSHNPQGYAAQSDQTLYNPYTEYQPHASYEPQAANPAYGAGQTYQGYQDEPFNPPRQSGYDTGAAPANTGFRQADGTYEKGADGLATPVTPARVKDTSAAGVRAWRYDHQGNLWSKVRNYLDVLRPPLMSSQGGRGSCIGRFCCCFIFSFIFILISVVLTLALVRTILYLYRKQSYSDYSSSARLTLSSTAWRLQRMAVRCRSHKIQRCN
jgi:hypothetical protein